MKILYCRVGWMNAYKGNTTEKPVGGGKYNQENIGHEVYNYLGYDNKYYGFVEPGIGKKIQISRLCDDKKAECAEHILVVWVAKSPLGGQRIIGWYKNATVYSEFQKVPQDAMAIRDLKEIDQYNIYSEDVFLIEPENREYCIEGIGQSNIWYGKSEIDSKVISYIENYDKENENRIDNIEKDLSGIVGEERESVVKTRVNQDKFRLELIKKYNGKCCLCGVSYEQVLVASHIKPWSKSDCYQKLDPENGLLLCPNHDKLFDSGLISFDDNGKIIISDKLDKDNRVFLNVNDTMKIDITEDNVSYIRYHRENIFN